MDQGQVAQTSPEKKLLKIIEGGSEKSADSGGSLKSRAVKKFNPASIFAFAKFIPRFHFSPVKLKDKLSVDAILSTDIKKINHLLMLVAAVTFVYFAINFVNYRKNASKDIFSALGKVKASEAALAIPRINVNMSQTASLETFLSKIRKRDYFKAITKQQKKVAAEKTAPILSSQAIDQATENLRLVGISFAPSPKDSYAMIEDTSTKITYFVKKDQAILGVKVADIEKDRVVLSLNDFQKELR